MAERFPELMIPKVDKVKIAIAKNAVRISFEALLMNVDLSRLAYLQASGAPLDVLIRSPQAEFDLELTEVSVKTGEIKGNG